MIHNLNIFENYFKSLKDGTLRWKVGIYVRLSKEDGKSISLSIENQIKSIARFLRNFEDYEIIEIYIDDGLTGTDFERFDYARLKEDVEMKIINCIIVKDLTRYSRNLADGIKELDNFVLVHNLRFISVRIPEVDTYKDPRQISSPEVYQALQNAEDFARITSIKVRDIQEQKREDGEKTGGFPPYGYLSNPDGQHFLYDPVAGEIVKKIYMMSANGFSDRAIARELNSLGIPNPTTYKQQVLKYKYYHPNTKNSGLWWGTTVHNILKDKNYIGYSVKGKSSSFDHKRHKQIPKKKDEYIEVANCHEQTISDELFLKVANKKSERTRSTKQGKIHLFANLVYCSTCKRSMKKTSSNNRHYLVCRTYKDLGKEYCTAKGTINMEKLENIILKAIQLQIKLIIDLQAIVSSINQKTDINNQSVRLEQMISSITKEMDKTQNIFDSSYYDWKNGDISKEQYQRIRGDTERKLEQIRNNLRSLVSQKRSIEKGITSNNEYFEVFLKHQNIEKLDRLILIELINKIYINEDKSIGIEFNYNDQYLLIMDYIEQNQDEDDKRMVLHKG